jgi:hypothetical protein
VGEAFGIVMSKEDYTVFARESARLERESITSALVMALATGNVSYTLSNPDVEPTCRFATVIEAANSARQIELNVNGRWPDAQQKTFTNCSLLAGNRYYAIVYVRSNSTTTLGTLSEWIPLNVPLTPTNIFTDMPKLLTAAFADNLTVTFATAHRGLMWALIVPNDNNTAVDISVMRSGTGNTGNQVPTPIESHPSRFADLSIGSCRRVAVSIDAGYTTDTLAQCDLTSGIDYALFVYIESVRAGLKDVYEGALSTPLVFSVPPTQVYRLGPTLIRPIRRDGFILEYVPSVPGFIWSAVLRADQRSLCANITGFVSLVTGDNVGEGIRSCQLVAQPVNATHQSHTFSGCYLTPRRTYYACTWIASQRYWLDGSSSLIAFQVPDTPQADNIRFGAPNIPLDRPYEDETDVGVEVFKPKKSSLSVRAVKGSVAFTKLLFFPPVDVANIDEYNARALYTLQFTANSNAGAQMTTQSMLLQMQPTVHNICRLQVPLWPDGAQGTTVRVVVQLMGCSTTHGQALAVSDSSSLVNMQLLTALQLNVTTNATTAATDLHGRLVRKARGGLVDFDNVRIHSASPTDLDLFPARLRIFWGMKPVLTEALLCRAMSGARGFRLSFDATPLGGGYYETAAISPRATKEVLLDALATLNLGTIGVFVNGGSNTSICQVERVSDDDDNAPFVSKPVYIIMTHMSSEHAFNPAFPRIMVHPLDNSSLLNVSMLPMYVDSPVITVQPSAKAVGSIRPDFIVQQQGAAKTSALRISLPHVSLAAVDRSGRVTGTYVARTFVARLWSVASEVDVCGHFSVMQGEWKLHGSPLVAAALRRGDGLRIADEHHIALGLGQRLVQEETLNHGRRRRLLTALPTEAPTRAPSTSAPSAVPSRAPSRAPTATNYTYVPSAAPSAAPTVHPTSVSPTLAPSAAPSQRRRC